MIDTTHAFCNAILLVGMFGAGIIGFGLGYKAKAKIYRSQRREALREGKRIGAMSPKDPTKTRRPIAPPPPPARPRLLG